MQTVSFLFSKNAYTTVQKFGSVRLKKNEIFQFFFQINAVILQFLFIK